MQLGESIEQSSGTVCLLLDPREMATPLLVEYYQVLGFLKELGDPTWSAEPALFICACFCGNWENVKAGRLRKMHN